MSGHSRTAGLAQDLDEPVGAGPGPVGDDDLGDAGTGQSGGGQRGHRACADHQGTLAPGPVGDIRTGRELLETEGDERLPGPVDPGLAVGTLTDPQGLLEQVVQQPAGGVQLLPQRQRVLDLAEDLALADDHRVQPAGHREEVVDSPVLVVHIEIRSELVQPDTAVLGEERGQLGDARVELVHVGVQLDAVAGGQHGSLGRGLRGEGVLEELGLRLGSQRGPLQHGDGGTAVAQPYDKKTHAGITAGMSPSGPFRPPAAARTGGAAGSGLPSVTSSPALRCSWKARI
ncbi:hypothetical protein GA0115254_119884 [Streptomyces sp. Ncost-T10-10d]|nr:hypothetical protein GA0115254_119884 [Streptomyces sp. Ncost-T10-10d]